MSALTDLIYGGSNAVAGLTEGAVNDAIAKYGAEKEIAFPDTAYFFPTIYAATGVKVKTLGDLPACVGVLKSLITNQEDLGQALGLEKLREEVEEFLEEKNLDELGDILEVLEELAHLQGWTDGEIRRAKEEKAQRNGAFRKRVFLEKVLEEG